MEQITMMEKYPVFTMEIAQDKTSYKNVDEILNYLKDQIEAHPIATYIGEFDHYAHTCALEAGEVSDSIKEAKNIICCFGKVLPKPEMLAIRPRSIGVAQMDESFVISFMEAPNPEAQVVMEKWVKGIANS